MSDDATTIAQIEALNTPEPASTPPASAAPAAPAPATSTPATPAPATAPVTLKDDDLVEVLQEGKMVQVPWKEARGGYMRTADYTRKTQEAARLRGEAEQAQQAVEAARSALTERETQINQVLADPQKVAAWYQMLVAQKQAEGQSPAQAQAGAQADMASLQESILAQTQQRIDKATEELETRQLAATYNQDITKVIDALKTEYPQLKAVRGIDRILREEVAGMKPNTYDEARGYFLEVAKAQAEELDSYITERGKVSAASRTNGTGIEPPGGTGILPAPKKYKGADDPEREKDMIAQIEQLMKGS